MDMLPPQAPPAQTQTVYHEAERSFDRLVATQAWLATEHASLPTLSDVPDGNDAQRLLAELDRWWHAAPSDPTDGASRRAAFAARIAAAANDLAILRHQDGTLDDHDRALVRTVTTATSGVPAGVTVSEALFDGTPYAGVLLIEDGAADGHVLVFSASLGWERFDARDVALDTLESRARRALVATADLPGIARQRLVGIDAQAFVASRIADADPFATFVDRAIAAQRDKIEQARFMHALAAGGTGGTATDMADAVTDALRSDYLFDPAGALAQRQMSLAEAMNEQRLSRVPAAVAADWRAASDRYEATLAHLAAQPAPAPAQGLQAFALDALRARLHAIGVTQDPADIDIEVENYHAVLPRAVVDFFAGGKPPTLALVDLAYRNIGDKDPVRLRAVDRQGQPIARLDDAALRRIVREIDLHQRYPAYLDRMLRTGEAADARRAWSVDAQIAQIRLLANEARLSYFLPGLPRSFRPDHAYRGYQWVNAVLNAPAASGRARVEGHPIVVSQLTFRGVEVRDVFMIGVRNPQSVSTVLLYTPDAPDGVTFREFDDRQHAARAFLYAPAFREYLLDRLPMEHARFRANGTRDFAGDRLANWVLGSSNASYTFTPEPFGEREVSGDIFKAMYETDIRLGQRNARWLTTGSLDAQSRWEQAFQQRMVASVFDVVKDVVTAPVHSAAAGWRLYDSIKAGDTRQAYVDFTAFYVASLWAAPVVQPFTRAMPGRGFVAGRFRAADTLVDARAAAPQKVVFEPQYRAPNVKRVGEAGDDGVHTIGGKTYIEHDGSLYGVRFDADYGTWRLRRPEAGSHAWGPAVVRTPMGGWAFQRVGLRGGSGRAGPSTARQADLFDDYLDEAERAFPEPVEREQVAARMRAELADGPPAPPITAAQRLRWTEAAQRARDRIAARGPFGYGVFKPVELDLTPRDIPGMRRILAEDVPRTLYYYDRLPYKRSRLVRPMHATNKGFLNTQGHINTQLVADGVPGVRVTSVPPTAPYEQINAGMGFVGRGAGRSHTFAVTMDTYHMVRPYTESPRPRVEVYAPIDGPAGTYYLMPTVRVGELELDGFNVQVLQDVRPD